MEAIQHAQYDIDHQGSNMTEREIGSDTFIVSEAKVLAHRLS
jgi:hypothetical protein